MDEIKPGTALLVTDHEGVERPASVALVTGDGVAVAVYDDGRAAGGFRLTGDGTLVDARGIGDVSTRLA